MVQFAESHMRTIYTTHAVSYDMLQNIEINNLSWLRTITKHSYFSDIESLMKDQRGGEAEKKPNLRRDVCLRG